MWHYEGSGDIAVKEMDKEPFLPEVQYVQEG